MLTIRGALATATVCVALVSACGMEPNLPPDRSEDAAPRPRVRVPEPIDPGTPGQSQTLLQHYVARDDNPEAKAQFKIPSGEGLDAEARSWTLPFKSKRMVAALLSTAARDQLDDLQFVLAPDARWGLPDPRMMSARPVFGDDGGEAFLQALRTAATRFAHPASYVNATAFELGVQERLRTGAEPMWAYYESGLDRILFRFRVIQGRAWIDYVGLFPDAPTQAQRVKGLGAPPPMSPPVRLPDGSVVPSRGKPGTKPMRRPINPG